MARRRWLMRLAVVLLTLTVALLWMPAAPPAGADPPEDPEEPGPPEDDGDEEDEDDDDEGDEDDDDEGDEDGGGEGSGGEGSGGEGSGGGGPPVEEAPPTGGTSGPPPPPTTVPPQANPPPTTASPAAPAPFPDVDSERSDPPGPPSEPADLRTDGSATAAPPTEVALSSPPVTTKAAVKTALLDAGERPEALVVGEVHGPAVEPLAAVQSAPNRLDSILPASTVGSLALVALVGMLVAAAYCGWVLVFSQR